jgi:preprotein translocase subunit SecF
MKIMMMVVVVVLVVVMVVMVIESSHDFQETIFVTNLCATYYSSIFIYLFVFIHLWLIS